MYRPATRIIARSSATRAIPRAMGPSRRFISTAPPAQKSRSWKSSAARWGLAGAIIYYYNTTDVFAEEPTFQSTPITEETENYPTIEAISKERQQRRAEEAAAKAVKEEKVTTAPDEEAVAPGSPEELEEEAGQQGAFNPETGEINWDCPCLGGMAHGPCGEEFKTAFSCFVYSTEEPKGMDCIDKFKGMQNCFRQYPEVYGSELEPDEDDEEGATVDQEQRDLPDLSPTQEHQRTENLETRPPAPENHAESAPHQDVTQQRERAKAAVQQAKQDHGEPLSESDGIVPKAWHDETQANRQVGNEKKT